jgi:hypothetical protein
MKRKLVVLLAIVAVACWVVPAAADMFSFQLNLGNSAISGFTGPYAEVTVDRTSATAATITFDGLSSGSNFYLLGDGGSVGFNVNGAFSLGTITSTALNATFTPGPFSNGGAGNEDGFGSFNQTINDFGGNVNSAEEIVVNITATGMNSWSSAQSVLTPNASGFLAAAHIFVSDGNAADANLATGFAAGGDPVPVPPSALLMGSGLLGLVGIGWGRRKT